jgi:hypothetical protein
MSKIYYKTPETAYISDPNIVHVDLGSSPVETGAVSIAIGKTRIDENVHVMWNHASEVFFAAPANYTTLNVRDNSYPTRLAEIAQINSIGKKYGEGNDEGFQLLSDLQLNINVYNKQVELIHPKGLKSGETIRMTGNLIQEGYDNKFKEMQMIKKIVIKLGNKVFGGRFADNVSRYGHLYYGVWLEPQTEPPRKGYYGWHRGVDINSTAGGGIDVNNIAEGIVVGISPYTMLDVYVPNDNVTITYMHHKLNPGINLGDTLAEGQPFGIESNEGAVGIHEHIEINLGCKCSSGTLMSQKDLATCVENYYDTQIGKKNDLINGLSNDLGFGTLMDFRQSLIEERNRLTIEKDLRAGITAERVNTSYASNITDEGLTSEYPYDYFDKWCK